MRPVPVGTKGSYEFVVERNDLAGTIEPSLPPVLATARMSLAMERAAIDVLKPFLEAGEMTVGAVVNVIHTAATPEGWKVRAEAEVTKCDGRRIEFNVSAFDEKEAIGTGTHLRAVVDRAKFDERFAAKVKSRS
ncbi:MAG TPA: thioesterase family protein [Candidatus Binataceae bacterium]|nr:thioesterase family protein [Candidatus Binataceae bacterium]